jgi:preprotein translocase subunit SecB
MTPPTPLSPTQLRDHRFTTVRVKTIEGGDPNAEPSLKPSIWFEPIPNTADQWRLVLTILLTSANPSKPFPYEAEFQLQGLVQVTDGLTPDRKEQLALVNGFSVLYSAAREMLLNITSRSAYGAVTLPTLSFVSLVTKARKKKAEDRKQTSAAPPA